LDVGGTEAPDARLAAFPKPSSARPALASGDQTAVLAGLPATESTTSGGNRSRDRYARSAICPP